MPNIPLFRYDPPVFRTDSKLEGVSAQSPPVPGTVSLTPAGAAGVVGVLIALSGAFQPWVTAWVTTNQQKRQEETRVRTEQITREATWLRSALALKAPEERNAALKFLVKAKLVADPNGELAKLGAAEIPYLEPIPSATPAPPGASPGIQNTKPPVPGGGDPQ